MNVTMLTLEAFLSFLAQVGESQRTVAQFEGMYLTLVALEDRLDKLVQPAYQWADDYNAWQDTMDALTVKVTGITPEID